jgi:hypothetical protein
MENGIYPAMAVPQVEVWAWGCVAQIQRTEVLAPSELLQPPAQLRPVMLHLQEAAELAPASCGVK